MQSIGKHVAHVLELLCTTYLCPILRTALISKTAFESVVCLCQIFLLIFDIYLTDSMTFWDFLILLSMSGQARCGWINCWGYQLVTGCVSLAPPGSLTTTPQPLELVSLTSLSLCQGKASWCPTPVMLPLQVMQHCRNELCKSGNNFLKSNSPFPWLSLRILKTDPRLPLINKHSVFSMFFLLQFLSASFMCQQC